MWETGIQLWCELLVEAVSNFHYDLRHQNLPQICSSTSS